MNSNLTVFCPRCPGSTRRYALDELREHVAKDHLEMTPLFNCPHCQVGFISPQMALYHFRFVCCIQQHFLTTTFTKNLLSMDISFFYQLYLVECEAIRCLLSTGSIPTPVPRATVEEDEPLVFADEDQDEVNRFLKKLRAELEGKPLPKSPPKEPENDPRDRTTRTTPVIPLTPQPSNPVEYGPEEPPQKPCPLSPRSTVKRFVSPSREPTAPKKLKTEEKKTPSPHLKARCYMDEVGERHHGTKKPMGSRLWIRQYGRRSVRDHACEYERCCDTQCREDCSFCNGLHRSQNCGVVIDFKERKMILRSKGICSGCGVKHKSKDESCQDDICKYCFSHDHWSSFCPSLKYQHRLDMLRHQERYPPSMEILKLQVERSAIYSKERSKERHQEKKDTKPSVSPSLKKENNM